MNLNQGLRQIVAVGIAGTAMVLNGCAVPPTEQLDAAQKTIYAAKAAGADVYAQEDFAGLEAQFALAKDELAKQEKAFFIVRSYAAADNLLAQVVKTGQQVEAKTAEKKEAAKTAAITMEKEAQAALSSARELMANAPTGKERAAVEAIKTDLIGLETNLGTVHELIKKGDYLGAESRAKALKESGSSVSQEIQHAIDKTKGKKPKAHA